MNKVELEIIEDERLENEKRLRKVETKVDDIYQHIQDGNNITQLISEGFKGEQANKYLNQQEELLQILYQKNMQYLDDEKEAYQIKKKQLSLKEEDLYMQRSEEKEDGNYF